LSTIQNNITVYQTQSTGLGNNFETKQTAAIWWRPIVEAQFTAIVKEFSQQ